MKTGQTVPHKAATLCLKASRDFLLGYAGAVIFLGGFDSIIEAITYHFCFLKTGLSAGAARACYEIANIGNEVPGVASLFFGGLIGVGFLVRRVWICLVAFDEHQSC